MKFYQSEGWTTEHFDRIDFLAKRATEVTAEFNAMVNAGGGSFGPVELMTLAEDQLRWIADEIKRIRCNYIA